MGTAYRVATLALAGVIAGRAGGETAWAAAPTVTPGTVVRWPGAEIEACAAAGRSWAPTGDACFFPVDMLASGSLRLGRRRAGRSEPPAVRRARLVVEDGRAPNRPPVGSDASGAASGRLNRGGDSRLTLHESARRE